MYKTTIELLKLFGLKIGFLPEFVINKILFKKKNKKEIYGDEGIQEVTSRLLYWHLYLLSQNVKFILSSERWHWSNSERTLGPGRPGGSPTHQPHGSGRGPVSSPVRWGQCGLPTWCACWKLTGANIYKPLSVVPLANSRANIISACSYFMVTSC